MIADYDSNWTANRSRQNFITIWNWNTFIYTHRTIRFRIEDIGMSSGHCIAIMCLLLGDKSMWNPLDMNMMESGLKFTPIREIIR